MYCPREFGHTPAKAEGRKPKIDLFFDQLLAGGTVAAVEFTEGRHNPLTALVKCKSDPRGSVHGGYRTTLYRRAWESSALGATESGPCLTDVAR